MVAYSFQKQFRRPILQRVKRHTIRADGRRRHAYPGEELQLYTGMRTRFCELILRAECESVHPIRLDLKRGIVLVPEVIKIEDDDRLDHFAQSDGFANWKELRDFWSKHHPGVKNFKGRIIAWHG